MKALSPDELLALGRAHMECRILLTAAELDLFTLLAPTALSVEQISSKLKADLRALTILLDALAAMGLLSKRDGAYRCEPEVARYLSAEAPESVLPMLLHSAGLWRRWSDLTRVVRQGGPSPAAGKRTAVELRAFIEAMEVVSRPVAPAVIAAIRPGSARSMLDVGGGPGSYTRAFLEAAPGAKATLFDQPDVLEIAREHLGKAGLLERVTLVGGDFYEDELPAGHDLALLSAIIHQNSPAENLGLYRKVLRALRPGGRIVVRDHVMEPDRTRPRRGAVFAVNMLVSTAGGGTYTFEEIRAGLAEAGFERAHVLQRDEQMSGLVEAFRPGA